MQNSDKKSNTVPSISHFKQPALEGDLNPHLEDCSIANNIEHVQEEHSIINYPFSTFDLAPSVDCVRELPHTLDQIPTGLTLTLNHLDSKNEYASANPDDKNLKNREIFAESKVKNDQNALNPSKIKTGNEILNKLRSAKNHLTEKKYLDPDIKEQIETNRRASLKKRNTKLKNLVMLTRSVRFMKKKDELELVKSLTPKQLELIREYGARRQNKNRFLGQDRDKLSLLSNKTSDSYGEYSESVEIKGLFGNSIFWRQLRKPFEPSGRFRLLWDLSIMILVIIDMIVLPLQISFNVPSNFEGFAYLCNIAFVVDIFLNFHTAYYEYGSLVTSHREIAKKYIKNWFLIDLIASFPFYALEDTISSEESSSRKSLGIVLLRLIKALRLIRLFKLRKISGRFTAFFYPQKTLGSMWDLIKLLILALFVAHWLASGWHFLAVLEIDNNNEINWIKAKNLEDASPYLLYVVCLYWSITTMLTVGYGDITPVSAPEYWFAVAAMFIGCGFFAYIINTIGSIIKQISEEKAAKMAKISIINGFTCKNQISVGVQNQIRGYLEYLLEEQALKTQEHEQFFNIIPDQLKKVVLIDLNGKLLTQNSVLNSNFGLSFLRDLATEIKEKTLSPGQDVLDESDNKSSFNFIVKGKIDLFLLKTGQLLRTLGAGDYFGEICFFSDKKQIFRATSTFFSDIFYLKKTKFMKKLQMYLMEKEKYCEIKDKIDLYNDYTRLKTRCYACNHEDHIIINCNQLQYVPSYEYIMQLVAKENKDFKENFIRKTKRRFNTLKDQSEVSNKAALICESLENLGLLETITKVPNLANEKNQEEFEMEQSRAQSKPKKKMNTLSINNKSILKMNKILDQKDEEEQFEPEKNFKQKKIKEDIIFDKTKSYMFYFPHNNIENVIKRINRLNEIHHASPLPLGSEYKVAKHPKNCSNKNKRFTLDSGVSSKLSKDEEKYLEKALPLKMSISLNNPIDKREILKGTWLITKKNQIDMRFIPFVSHKVVSEFNPRRLDHRNYPMQNDVTLRMRFIEQ